jgi:hypothetical protein
MKTMIVCASANINRHVGEYYDEVLEVENTPTTETIDRWGNAIMGAIRKLYSEDMASGGKGEVSVTLDAVSPYNAILMNLQIIMQKEEGIQIELPYLPKDIFKVEDAETKELFEKIGERG